MPLIRSIVHRPELTEEERERRMENIKRAAVAVLVDQERARLRKQKELEEQKQNEKMP